VWKQVKYPDYWQDFLACYELTCRVKKYMPQVQWPLPFPEPIPEKLVVKERARRPRKKKENPMFEQLAIAECQTTTPYEDIIP
jgi:hypothetical protein